MKKPFVIWFSQISLALVALSYGLMALGSVIGLFGSSNSIGQGLFGLAIGAGITCACVLLLIKVESRSMNRRVLVLCFWGILFLYPIVNALSVGGILPPRVTIEDNERLGAAVAEIIRYAGLLTLIVWLSFSKASLAYLSSGTNQPLNAIAPKDGARH